MLAQRTVAACLRRRSDFSRCLKTIVPLRTQFDTSPLSAPRFFCTQRTPLKRSEIVRRAQGAPPPSVTLVKEAAKTSFNFVFVGGCVALTGAILYAIGDALFGKSSPFKVFDASFDIIKDDDEVAMMFGEPLRAFCDGSRRRNRLSSEESVVDGVPHVRINYHVEGPRAKGNVFVEARNSGRSFDYNYIVVQIPRKRPIVVIDNRQQFAAANAH